jgi:hypothetical protein
MGINRNAVAAPLRYILRDLRQYVSRACKHFATAQQ